MKEKSIVILICIISVLIIAVISLDCGDVFRAAHTETSQNLLLIDPGHGGMDGGAVGSDGTLEKDINLAVAGELCTVAEDYGWKVVMTRQQDEWLCSREEGSIRSRKTEDLKNRCEMIRKYRPELAVSIHLNSFKEDPSVKGSQVFYPETADEKCVRFAEAVQDSLNRELQPDNVKTAMVRKDVMLFRSPECPVIIVECGFLSNSSELNRLKSSEYQRKLAIAIMDGVMEFTDRKKPENVEIIDSLR